MREISKNFCMRDGDNISYQKRGVPQHPGDLAGLFKIKDNVNFKKRRVFLKKTRLRALA